MTNQFAALVVTSLSVFGFSVSTIHAQDVNENAPKAVRIENSRSGDSLTMSELVEDAGRADVIFLGEQHDNDSGHEFQLSVIRELVKQGHSIAVSTEQFERDTQGALDDYLNGRIEEDVFLNA